MANGLTIEQMNERMYTALVGIDGSGGIVKDIADAKKSRKTIYDKVDVLEDNAVTKKECASYRKHEVSEKRNRWLVTKDVFFLALAAAAIIVSVVALV